MEHVHTTLTNISRAPYKLSDFFLVFRLVENDVSSSSPSTWSTFSEGAAATAAQEAITKYALFSCLPFYSKIHIGSKDKQKSWTNNENVESNKNAGISWINEEWLCIALNYIECLYFNMFISWNIYFQNTHNK